ncbi:MAG: Gp37 family protein [Thermodesulfobacteriota bacterium]
MIKEIIDDVISELSAISGLSFVELAVAENEEDLEELLKTPKRLPGCYVVYRGADFTKKRVIGSNAAEHEMEILVLLIAKNLRSQAEGARTCYDFIEAIRSALIGHSVGNYGSLWPLAEDLIAAGKGLQCYGLIYGMETKTG